jgi:toxin co-regulated pilus biosynthesis protein Q
VLILLVVALSGCATRPAPDFGGRWKAVNRYAASAEEIPLYQSYVFHASPMDGTLKTMLTRWANDSKMTLSYLHPSDFTLYGPVAQIQTNDLQQAVSQLSAAYAAQQVSVTASNNQIVVRVVEAGGEAPAATDAPATTP